MTMFKCNILWVWWSISGIVHFEQTVNTDFRCKQLNRIFCEKVSDNLALHTVQDEPWKKLMKWDGRYYLIHHTYLILHSRISYSYNIFLVTDDQNAIS